MSNNLYLKFLLEIIWLIFTLLVIWIIMLPIVSEVPHFPFKWHNALFIGVFITLFRYIFFLRHTWLEGNRIAQSFLILAGVSLVVLLLRILNEFTLFLDEEGMLTLLGRLPHTSQLQLSNYIRTEFLIFGVGSVIASIILPIRLLIALWRDLNIRSK